MSSSARPTIRVVHHLARSGGTLICKCLGCMESVNLLSEVHPTVLRLAPPYMNGHFHPIVQAHRWFDLFTKAEATDIFARPHIDFADLIQVIHQRCAHRGKLLVLRDWTHLDFTSHEPFPRPTYRLRILDSLARHFDIRHVCTVRHPLDLWLSLRRLTVLGGKLTVADYLRGCLRFAELSRSIGFMRYEDFTASPEAHMQQLCAHLRVPFDGGFVHNWSGYRTITGEVNGARGGTQIKTLPRRECKPELLATFAANPDYRRSLELLGYRHPHGVTAPGIPAPKMARACPALPGIGMT